MAFLKTHPQKENITFPVLVPNLKGLEAAIKSGATEVAIFGAASEGFSKANINCTIDESLARFKEVCDVALAKGIRARGYISTPPPQFELPIFRDYSTSILHLYTLRYLCFVYVC